MAARRLGIPTVASMSLPWKPSVADAHRRQLSRQPRADAGCAGPAALARPLLQPRALVAELQSAGAGGGREPAPSAAGAAALPVDLGQQPRRVLHGPRRRPEGAGARRRARAQPGRPVGRRSSWCKVNAAANDLMADQQRIWRAHARRAGRPRACVLLDAKDITAADRPAIEEIFLSQHLPGADAAGDRPGPPVPVHPQPRLLAGAEAAAAVGQQAALRPGAGADPGRPVLGAAAGATAGASTRGGSSRWRAS